MPLLPSDTSSVPAAPAVADSGVVPCATDETTSMSGQCTDVSAIPGKCLPGVDTACRGQGLSFYSSGKDLPVADTGVLDATRQPGIFGAVILIFNRQ